MGGQVLGASPHKLYRCPADYPSQIRPLTLLHPKPLQGPHPLHNYHHFLHPPTPPHLPCPFAASYSSYCYDHCQDRSSRNCKNPKSLVSRPPCHMQFCSDSCRACVSAQRIVI